MESDVSHGIREVKGLPSVADDVPPETASSSVVARPSLRIASPGGLVPSAGESPMRELVGG